LRPINALCYFQLPGTGIRFTPQAWEGKEKMLNFKGLALVAAFLGAVPVFSAVPTEEGSSSIQAEVPVAPKFQPRFTGLLEFRPSFITEGSEFHTENLIDIGYTFSPNFRITAQQVFNTNLSDPWEVGASKQPILQQGFVRATFSNLVNIDGWTLTYEPRIYVPQNQMDFDTKRYATLRNYFMLSKTFGAYTLTFMEIPIFHVHGSRGSVSENGRVAANQYFENRFYIMNDFQFGRLSVSFPILFVSKSKLDYSGVEGDWANALWFWPEVAYALDDNIQVGAALYTESIISPDLSGFTIADRGAGLRHSVAQLLLRASL
jgi:hypothetical protein